MYRRQFLKVSASAAAALISKPSHPELREKEPLERCSVRLAGLTCEYRERPLAIDSVKPRLGWRLVSVDVQERGQTQTSYRLLVASSEESLLRDKGDLWDSGNVVSKMSAHVVYAGTVLRSTQTCYWKVRIADEHGTWSDWSNVASWTMGLLQILDWKAKWIRAGLSPTTSTPPVPNGNQQKDPWFRKLFSLSTLPKSARLHVASIGYHELYINGVRVGENVLTPATTDLRGRARYVTYPIEKYLHQGTNAIGLWLGVSWSIFPGYLVEGRPAEPMVIAQAAMDFVDGASLLVTSDSSWRTYPSPNQLLGAWDAHLFGGERYDARLEVPDWCSEAFDDTQWKHAEVSALDIALSADTTEPNQRVKKIDATSVEHLFRGTFRIDMGVNYAGWFELPVQGNPGDVIKFQFSERADQATTFGLASEFVIGSTGEGRFCNRFNYMSGRWVTVTGLERAPQLGDAVGWQLRPIYTAASSFTSDQPLLNGIHRTTLWTLENLSLGNYFVDCPQRERRGYGGDGYACIRTALTNFHMGAFLTKWAQDWRDVQGEDGAMPNSAPTYLGGGGPSWGGMCVTLPWEMYSFYGDRRVLEVAMPTIERWLAFLESHAKEDLLVRWGDKWSFLGDWSWPQFGKERAELAKMQKALGDTPESLFFNNCYWIFNLQTAAKIARATGQTGLSEAYAKRAAQIRLAVHKTFFRPAERSYVNGSPAYLAAALLAEVPPEELRAGVRKRLEEEILIRRGGHVWAGITGGAVLFDALLEERRDDLIHTMVSQTTYPGWGDMLARGNTTFCEDWECGGSLLHNSFLYVGAWFVEGLGGIRRPAEGFRYFEIEPWLPDLEDGPNAPRHVSVRFDSPFGSIDVEWQLVEQRFSMRVTVPPGSEAILRIRRAIAGSVTEGAASLERAKGVRHVPQQTGVAVALVAGTYSFTGLLASAEHSAL